MKQDVTSLFVQIFQFTNERVVNLTDVTPLQKNTGDQICHSNARIWHYFKGMPGTNMSFKWQTWHYYKGILGIRYVTQRTDMKPLQRNIRDKICYSRDRHDTARKECIWHVTQMADTSSKKSREPDMFLKWQTWHHYKGMSEIWRVTQMADMTLLQRYPGDHICYSNDRHDTTKNECRGSDTLL